jgi:hypothetical protein
VQSWHYGRPNCFEARYEDLRQDADLSHWRRIAAFLGFDEDEQQSCCRRFWQNIQFGGLPRLGNRHVRSGDVAQWKREFTRDLGYAFLERFPDTLQTLGYEMNNSWVLKLQQPGSTGRFLEAKRLAAIHLAVVMELARYF